MDLRLLPIAIGLWLGTAVSLIVISSQSRFTLFIWLITLTLLGFAFRTQRVFAAWDLTSNSLAASGLVVGLILATFRLLPITTGPVAQAVKQEALVEVRGTVVSDVQRSKVTNALDMSTRDFGVLKLRTTSINFHGQTFAVRVPISIFVSGESIEKVKVLPLGTEVVFDAKFKNGDAIRGVAANATLVSEFQISSTAPRYQYLATKFRIGLHQALIGRNAQVAGLVPGLALGDNSNLNASLNQNMKASGLTHLTAVSGSNVTMLIAIVLLIGRKFRLKHSTNYLLSVVALGAFVIVVRPQPSVLRAAAMGLVMVFALFSRSQRSPIPALTASVIFLIAVDPWLAISYGFALSVGATSGLLLLAKNLLASLDRQIPKRIPEWLVLGLVVTISAQVAVFPILVGLGSVISLASIPANLISVPLSGPTMVLGLCAALAAPFSSLLAQSLAWLATLPAWGIVDSANFFAKQKWLVIPWPHGIAGVCLALVVVIAGIHLRLNWRNLLPIQKQTAVAAWVILLACLWLKPINSFRNWTPTSWQVASCDVGQGDATVVKVSRDEAIVVDVGGDPELIDNCLAQLHVRTIPLLLLTHFHADHVVGLPGALSGRDVGQIRISPLADPPLTTAFVYQVLTEFEKSVEVMSYPDYLRIGDVELFCIWPERKVGENQTPNNASVSLLIKSKVDNGEPLTLLLPGDIEQPAQDEIVQKIGSLKVDVIKVPHHGSRNQSQTFAQRSEAKLALVSSGKDNEYGHPAPETVFLYETIGAKVIRTDEHGSIAVQKTGNGLSVETQR